jgi:hypothetical protein
MVSRDAATVQLLNERLSHTIHPDRPNQLHFVPSAAERACDIRGASSGSPTQQNPADFRTHSGNLVDP